MNDVHLAKLKEGNVPIGAKDKNGKELHQFDHVYCDGYESCILWSGVFENYAAVSTEGGYLVFEDLHLAEKVEYTDLNEVHYEEVSEIVMSSLSEEEVEKVLRLLVAYNNAIIELSRFKNKLPQAPDSTEGTT